MALVKLIIHATNGVDQEVLLLTALYHDAVYDPTRGDNEEASAALLRLHAVDVTNQVVQRAAELIVSSKWVTPPSDPLGWQFWEMDCQQLAPDYPLSARLAYERAIFREYQWVSWPVYLTKRREFLETGRNDFHSKRKAQIRALNYSPPSNLGWPFIPAASIHFTSAIYRRCGRLN